MAETMEQYMSKTRVDYGSGVFRPEIKDRDDFELKGQFLKELRTNTFSGSDHEDANKHIEKVLKIVDLFHIPNITIDQVMLRAFPMSLTGAASRWLRNKPTGSITTWEDLKTKFLSKYCPPARTAKKMEEINNFQQEPDENLYQAWERFKELLMKCPQHYLTEMQEVVLFYNGLDVPTRQILDSRGAIPSKTVADAKTTIQEMAEYSQKWHNGTSRVRSTETSNGLVAIQAELNKLGREIKKRGGYRATTPGYYQRNNANPSYQERRQSMEDTLSKFMSELAKRHDKNSNLIKEIRAATNNSTLLYKSRQMKVPFPIRLDNHYYEEEEGNYGPKFAKAYGALHIKDTIPRKEKDLGRLGELAHTKLIVELADRTVKYLKGIAENVLVGISKFTFLVDSIILDMPEDIKVLPLNPRLRERMGLDLEARLMGETLVINRSLDPFLEDYIELNDLNEPFKLRRNQGDD
ncbi:hypothetical protein Tco_0583583 [Tanacetum coccineum]